MTSGERLGKRLEVSANGAEHHGFDDRSEMRIDLHLHSRASGTATNWWVKSLGFGLETRESYTSPEDAYRMAKLAGMDFVTLTDHETIDGATTLVHNADFLVGEEVSATFPEDGSWVDVLVYGLDADGHRAVQARRRDVYALVDYLRERGLVHVLAHPMFEIGTPIDRAGMEKRLVLFGLWEFINGSRPAQQNRLTEEVAAGIGPVELRQMALRQGLTVPPHRAIAGTGGSDDHGGIYGGRTYTVVPRVTNVSDLLAPAPLSGLRASAGGPALPTSRRPPRLPLPRGAQLRERPPGPLLRPPGTGARPRRHGGAPGVGRPGMGPHLRGTARRPNAHRRDGLGRGDTARPAPLARSAELGRYCRADAACLRGSAWAPNLHTVILTSGKNLRAKRSPAEPALPSPPHATWCHPLHCHFEP